MKVNDIVVLEDDKRYILLSEITYENEHYFLASNVDEENNFNLKDIVIFHKTNDNVAIVVDDDLIIKLAPLLQNAIEVD